MNFTDRDELERRLRRRRRHRRREMFWNFLTFCIIAATVVLAGVLVLIYSNPYVSINPFPPPTLPALVEVPTSTATPVILPATWTPTPRVMDMSSTPSSTFELVTLTPTETPDPLTPTVENTAGTTYSFSLQGSPSYLNVDLFKPGTGCNWQGVAGQVVDLQGRHMVNMGIMIELKGTYNGKTLDTQTIPGTHTEYGESGYEFQLGTSLVNSTGLLSIQLVDQAGLPLSDQVIFDTAGTCDKNLVMINFRQVK